MKAKENLFSKNSYDTQLEEILDNKKISDEARGLILNGLYKIDIAYKDYAKIKSDVKMKNEIITEIIEIVKNDCDTIELFDPKDTKNKFSVDKDNKKIKVLPNEILLFQALYYIDSSKYKNIKNLFNKVMMNVVAKGNAINGAEIIRDFNGWSWNNGLDNNLSIYYNLIFQDLHMLVGCKTLNVLLKTDNFRENLIGHLQGMYGEKKASEIINRIDICCMIIYMRTSVNNQKECLRYLKRQQKHLNMLENKSEYISRITLKNNKNMQVIGKIDNILKNRNLLEKRYLNPEVKEKFKMLDLYKEHLIRIQRKKSREIDRNANLINPFEYVKRKKSVKTEIDLLNKIVKVYKDKNAIESSLIELQRSTISCFYKKIEVYDLKRELINLVYEMRYYNFLPINKEKRIKDTKELDVDLNYIKKKLVSKLYYNKILDVFSKDYDKNYFILKHIFDTKTINITKLDVKLHYENKKLFIEYYDENVLEKKLNISFNNDDLIELTKRTDRKLKMFI